MTFANMHFDHIFGRPAAEFLGQRRGRRIVHPDDLRRVSARRRALAFQDQQPLRAEDARGGPQREASW